MNCFCHFLGVMGDNLVAIDNTKFSSIINLLRLKDSLSPVPQENTLCQHTQMRLSWSMNCIFFSTFSCIFPCVPGGTLLF
jgi:hypothetical protein